MCLGDTGQGDMIAKIESLVNPVIMLWFGATTFQYLREKLPKRCP